MRTVHPGVMRLKRNSKRSLKQTSAVLARIRNGLLNIPLYIPAAPSSSLCTKADVSMSDCIFLLYITAVSKCLSEPTEETQYNNHKCHSPNYRKYSIQFYSAKLDTHRANLRHTQVKKIKSRTMSGFCHKYINNLFYFECEPFFLSICLIQI